MNEMKPMEAVAALYSNGREEESRAIVASISRAIFENHEFKRAPFAKKVLSLLSLRVLKRTTKKKKVVNQHGVEVTEVTNRILDRSGHAYARALMGSTSLQTEVLVEGGDPMNSQYMMMCPVIRSNGQLWDRLFLDSVQARDVRLRMALETLATYDEARQRLDSGKPVRLKAVAAGTGLSMILVYDKLVREGIEPSRITAVITDRDEANTDKANRLMDKLETTRGRHATQAHGAITARAEDIFADRTGGGEEPYDVVTAIGILEYFHGHTYTTTEEKLGLVASHEPTSAEDLVHRLRHAVADHGRLIVNTYRRNAATQLLEIFGRRFDYRTRDNLKALMATGGFQPVLLKGSGNIYDVEVYGKSDASLAR